MEVLSIIGLVGNIVQFIDFSSKLIAETTKLYRSNENALAENIDVETATSHLVLLNNKIKDAATITSDDVLRRLCESCQSTADELLAVLNNIKVDSKQGRWKSIWKALRNVWSKEQISELEGRLERFRKELHLHIVVDLRYVSMLSDKNYANQIYGIESGSCDLC
jgi:hypothetical protein